MLMLNVMCRIESGFKFGHQAEVLEKHVNFFGIFFSEDLRLFIELGFYLLYPAQQALRLSLFPFVHWSCGSFFQ
jgi:hypothetical protein